VAPVNLHTATSEQFWEGRKNISAKKAATDSAAVKNPPPVAKPEIEANDDEEPG